MSRTLVALLVALSTAGTSLAQLTQQDGAQPAGKVSVEARVTQLKQLLDAKNWAKVIEVAKPVTVEHPENQYAWFALGYALHSQGKFEEALEPDQKAAGIAGDFQPTAAYNAACALALLGRKDDAFAWLDKAREVGFLDMNGQLEADTDLASLHADPRWAKFKAALANPSRGTALKPKAPAAAPAVDAPSVMVRTQAYDRGFTRIAWFLANGPGPQIAIDFGRAEWHPEYAAAVEAGKFDGQRWRLGKDFWTNFDSNVDVKFGDVEIPAGQYYLVLSRADGAYTLTFVDPAEVRRKHLDAFRAKDTNGGIDVPLKAEKADVAPKALDISIAKDDANPANASLVIAFGSYRLTGAFTATLP